VVCALGFGLLAGYAVAHRAQPGALDLALHRWAVAHRGGVTDPAVGITETGYGPVAYLLAVLAGAAAARTGADVPRAVAVRRGLRGVVLAAAVLALAELVRSSISIAVARARPPVADRAWPATGFSFPSGHTATSAVVALLLCAAVGRRVRAPAARWALRGPALLWAVLVAASRVVLGVHWPSDVVGSWLLVGALALGASAAVPPGALDRLLDGRLSGGWRPPARSPGASRERRAARTARRR
jgi:undecaprenyl-diphosphatase